MRTLFVPVAVVAVAALFALVGCGGSSDTGTAPAWDKMTVEELTKKVADLKTASDAAAAKSVDADKAAKDATPEKKKDLDAAANLAKTAAAKAKADFDAATKALADKTAAGAGKAAPAGAATETK